MQRAQDKFDLFGREIKPGDVIAYPVTVGRSAAMRIMRVVSVDVATTTDWLRENNYRAVRVPAPEDGFTLMAEYLPESMDWGRWTQPSEFFKPQAQKRLLFPGKCVILNAEVATVAK